MHKNLIIVILTLLIGLPSLAQNNINDYKYVIVPVQFDFLKGKDKYRTSTLTRYLFKKEGFEVYFDEEELPADLFQNRCLALYADVLKVSNFLNVKTQIELKDCYGNVIFLTQEGSTKIKEYDKAYSVAIRKAFESVEALNYKFNPDSKVGHKSEVIAKTKSIQESTEDVEKAKAEVQRLKKEVEDLKRQKEFAKAKPEPNVEKKQKELESVKKQNSKIKKENKSATKINSDVLYAQPIDKGFQLVDASPKVVMILMKTAAPNVYTVKGKQGIVFKDGDKWYYSESDSKKELNIKF